MKVVNLGSNSTTSYSDTELSQYQKQTKYGTMTYFKNRIILVKNTPTADYSIWTSSDGIAHLVLGYDKEIMREISAIKLALSAKSSTIIDWKANTGNDAKTFVKLDKACTPIPLNCELRYTIVVYGVFLQKASNTSFLQFSVLENETGKLSFLKPDNQLNYLPNSNLWESFDNLAGL